MRKFSVIFLLILTYGIGFSAPYPERIVQFTVGKDYNPDFQDTSRVFGPPQAESTTGLAGSLDVLNIGIGGSITLSFENNPIYNGEGVDFAVFENPFYINGSYSEVFLEPAYVFVSSDGNNWVSFPSRYVVQSPPMNYDNNPAHYINFAGINPVFSNTQNGINPLDPSVSGGDWFDLEEIKDTAAIQNVDINNIKFIKIVDVEVHVGTDSYGNIIPGAYMPSGLNGFDLDAVAARYTKSQASEAKSKWELYE